MKEKENHFNLDKDSRSDGDSGEHNCKITYIYNRNVALATTIIPNIFDRSILVHDLIEAYGLTSKMNCESSNQASIDDLLTFHSSEYIKRLSTGKSYHELSNNSFDVGEIDEHMFGLGYDCPTFENMELWARLIVGGTISAAKALLKGSQYAINWCGGWHHAQRDSASGFCYVNDIVIGIHELQKKFQRILYVDLDAHHGDGVENAFYLSKKVMTLSFHHYEAGYFPGTGDITDVGCGKGKYYAVNIPLKSGIVDNQFIYLFSKVFSRAVEKYKPNVLVVQCGADCLAQDKLGYSNLTPESIENCILQILDTKLPALFLGGGGYNIINSAKLWTRLTAVIVHEKLPTEIPDHKNFLRYGPDYEISVNPTLRKNEMEHSLIESLIRTVHENLENVTAA